MKGANDVTGKFCGGCKAFKSSEHFHKATKRPDGLATQCAECIAAYGKRRYEQHRDSIRAQQNEKRRPFLKPVIIRQPVPREDGAFDIPLSNGMVVIVDAEDLPLVSDLNWSAAKGRKTWYAVRNDGNGGQLRMHQHLLGVSGSTIVDHKDGKGLNNRRSNLRVASHSQNLQNADAFGTIPYRGVHFSRSRSGNPRYAAKIQMHKKVYHLGAYSTPEEAAQAYDRKALSLYGEHARLNFPST